MKLYSYQKEGIETLVNKGRHILADDMGLGKTVQSLVATEKLRGAKKCKKKVLIVTTSFMQDIWQQELEKWLGKNHKKRSIVLRTTNQKEIKSITTDNYYRYIIINHSGLPSYESVATKFSTLIVDEAHKLKNRKSKRSKAAMKLSLKVDNIFLLTGTPVVNKSVDVWPLLKCIDKKTYSSFWRFADEVALVYQGRFGYVIEDVYLEDTEKEKAFHNHIDSHMTRRTKIEVLKDLPDKTIIQIPIQLSTEEWKIYNELEKEFITLIEDEIVYTPNVVSLLTRLRQICISPRLPMYKEGPLNSSKAEGLVNLLEELGPDEKVIIFSCYLKALQGLKEDVQNNTDRKNVQILSGKNKKFAPQILSKFRNTDTHNTLFMTIQAGGEGITLSEAKYAIFIDKFWTPAANRQAQDRLHRIGQKNAVTIYELIASSTVEEYMEAILNNKQLIINTRVEKLVGSLKKYKGR